MARCQLVAATSVEMNVKMFHQRLPMSVRTASSGFQVVELDKSNLARR
jgi:hypothetical protein